MAKSRIWITVTLCLLASLIWISFVRNYSRADGPSEALRLPHDVDRLRFGFGVVGIRRDHRRGHRHIQGADGFDRLGHRHRDLLRYLHLRVQSEFDERRFVFLVLEHDGQLS